MIGSHKITMEVQAGCSIECAANDAQWLADKANVTVVFEFNSVECFAVPGGDPETLISNQQEMQNQKPRVFSDDRGAIGVARFNV